MVYQEIRAPPLYQLLSRFNNVEVIPSILPSYTCIALAVFLRIRVLWKCGVDWHILLLDGLVGYRVWCNCQHSSLCEYN
jgi:hypothetical protein